MVMNCPDDINMVAEQGSSFFQVNWDEPTAVDTRGGVVSVMASHTPPRFFNVPSDNEITYTFTSDSSGATATCVFTITVRGKRFAHILFAVVYFYFHIG